MSRKNLSRTVIEGGRSHRNIFDRQNSHCTERARVRVWLSKVRLDMEAANDSDPRHRPRVGKWFSDKLGPARRWLEGQVGRPWSKVNAELLAKFDTRTTAGRHIVQDHMLEWVSRGPPEATERWKRPEFIVDARGILRTTCWYRPSWAQLKRETRTWTAGRSAKLTHRGWWWLWLRPEGQRCTGWKCPVASHRRVEDGYYHSVKIVADHAMSRGDVRRLFALPVELRQQIVIQADR